MEITLKLSEDAVRAILNLMGETPSKSGFFPLMIEIQKQIEAQKPQERQLPN